GDRDPRIPLHDRPLLELPLEVAAVEQVHLRVAESGEQPGQEGRVDIARLARAVDDDGPVRAQSQAGEQLSIGTRGEQPSGDAPFARPESLAVEVLGTR